MSEETLLHIDGVSKLFGSVLAVDDVSIEIKAGEIFALLGPSGCGKSTLLRMIAGLEVPTDGDILLDNNSIVQTPANKRPINMVFQSYAVFPHMTVADNVAYGLKADRVPAAEIKTRVSEALAQVQMTEQRDRKPHQLSGGQRQRVALARALIKRPRVLLLDEPLSALDAKLRDQMRLELVKLQETVGVTFIIVTHDQAEAMAMADRIAVLKDGRLCQIAAPEDLYQSPTDTFVADFIGKINLFDVNSLTWEDGQVVVNSPQLGEVRLPVSMLSTSVLQALGQFKPDDCWQLGLRPEKLRIYAANSGATDSALHGTIGDIAFQGVNNDIEVLLQGTESSTRSLHAIRRADDSVAMADIEQGKAVRCSFDVKDLLLLPDHG